MATLPIANADLITPKIDGVAVGNAATKSTGTGAGDVATGNHGHAASAITGLPVTKCFGIADPGGYFSDVLEVVPLILEAEAELTITKLKLSCNANPDTELECDFMYADSWPALANPVTIDVADTTDGEYEATSFDAATVPAGKCVYLLFNAAPDAALKLVSGLMEYTR